MIYYYNIVYFVSVMLLILLQGLLLILENYSLFISRVMSLMQVPSSGA